MPILASVSMVVPVALMPVPKMVLPMVSWLEPVADGTPML